MAIYALALQGKNLSQSAAPWGGAIWGCYSFWNHTEHEVGVDDLQYCQKLPLGSTGKLGNTEDVGSQILLPLPIATVRSQVFVYTSPQCLTTFKDFYQTGKFGKVFQMKHSAKQGCNTFTL